MMNKKQLFSSEHIHSGEDNKYAQKYKYKAIEQMLYELE